ncbi:4-hydroxythreonine-4-phosphate dehydrogenase [Anseongella ginsenosidimutans]|uniref:4-hydroxythreonine-4-phosphate dehydrogenase n=1 Tax=Anseongella ginsenosidimutans TaxID=496056 RepID=A0A4R3KQU7_9SPHI|nr:4-hydroxythreonine-4-phosphate dehydrogenase PdxA [Anseongella ginsenosidimutans]QEC52181.1 4-hydroxythreonine-4-phosphate dehydrogenase PdxA [Anseongella ginsenosidimutans]TCS86723.1 4-hydroxythreonine-4-phosphate dehydrogenase [Anseongella ginsenosidimutans]
MSNIKLKAGITFGDINGIGLEVIMKALLDNRINELCTPVVYGSVKIASFHRKALGIQDFSFQIIQDAASANPKRANLVNCWEEEVKVDLGENTGNGGKYALKSLQAAVKDLKEGKIDLLVTAPFNKTNIQSDEFHFPGHTEYLQQAFGSGDVLMFMITDELKIGVVTGHIPLKDVSASLSKEKIHSKLRLMNESLKKDFWIEKPRIAVLGLNPHAGDQGLLGREEKEIIIPAVNQAYSENILAFGPYPADAFFGKEIYKTFDGVLAMYHDQGLIPFKSIAAGEGVNFTAGLPAVRTSPDHGTAFDIAGKGLADESSFRKALFSAIDIVNRRREHAELSVNPLPVSRKDDE